jgi:chloramphenicol-sensitive protein RarD
MANPSFGKGILFAISAYLLWGVLPLYWKLLAALAPLHILAYRILFSLLLVGSILLVLKITSWLRFYRERRQRKLIILASLTVSFNWGLYIIAVNSGHTIDASLGYYITPLLSIVLGMVFFREKLKPLQLAAFGLAFAGVAILTVLAGRLPLISLGLAASFSFYGFLKKTVSFSALESLGAETLIASPLGLLLLFGSFGQGGNYFGLQGVLYWLELPLHTLTALLFCGFLTSFPLYLFSRGAKTLPLSTLGFIQFLSPTLSFLTGFFIFKESFPPRNFIAFGFIWTAVFFYIISLNTRGLSGARRQE